MEIIPETSFPRSQFRSIMRTISTPPGLREILCETAMCYNDFYRGPGTMNSVQEKNTILPYLYIDVLNYFRGAIKINPMELFPLLIPYKKVMNKCKARVTPSFRISNYYILHAKYVEPRFVNKKKTQHRRSGSPQKAKQNKQRHHIQSIPTSSVVSMHLKNLELPMYNNAGKKRCVAMKWRAIFTLRTPAIVPPRQKNWRRKHDVSRNTTFSCEKEIFS
ncbi:hypothetical protein BJV82DRAFT_659483, partial [Fennellomyces sp. T-0311]